MNVLLAFVALASCVQGVLLINIIMYDLVYTNKKVLAILCLVVILLTPFSIFFIVPFSIFLELFF